jgi:hypothetical protein
VRWQVMALEAGRMTMLRELDGPAPQWSTVITVSDRDYRLVAVEPNAARDGGFLYVVPSTTLTA